MIDLVFCFQMSFCVFSYRQNSRSCFPQLACIGWRNEDLLALVSFHLTSLDWWLCFQGWLWLCSLLRWWWLLLFYEARLAAYLFLGGLGRSLDLRCIDLTHFLYLSRILVLLFSFLLHLLSHCSPYVLHGPSLLLTWTHALIHQLNLLGECNFLQSSLTW